MKLFSVNSKVNVNDYDIPLNFKNLNQLVIEKCF